MHPYVVEGLARERIAELRRDAERERLALSVPPKPAQAGLRVALGERLVRMGLRLARADGMGPVALRLGRE